MKKALALGFLLALVACQSAGTPKGTEVGVKTAGGDAPLGDLSIFDACQRQVSLGLGVFYMCEQHGFGAFISELFPWERGSWEANLKDFTRSSAKSIHGPGGQLSEAPGTLSLFTDQMPAIYYRAEGFEDAPDFEGHYTISPLGGGVRVIACVTSSAWAFERCESVLRLLYPERVFVALGNRYKVSAPMFAGTALSIPEGCHKTGARTITCPDSELAISPVPIEDLDAASDEIKADQVAFFRKMCPSAEAWSVPCALGGEAATCHQARCVDNQGALHGVVALAQVRGKPYAASCRFDPQRFEVMPPVCGQVLDAPIGVPEGP